MSLTRRFVEQRIEKRRVQETKDMDLRRRIAETNILAGHGKSETRVEDMRRARSEAAERRDLFIDYSYTRAEQDKARKTQIAQFEEHIADELARQKAEQLRKDMDKMRICNASEELRQLKSNLHMAKVNKERAQQLLEIEIRKQSDQLHEQKLAEVMEYERLGHMELEYKLQMEKASQRSRVKLINQQQIATKEKERQTALHEYLKEKDQVRELVEKIATEDAMEQAAKEQKKKESQDQRDQFMRDQKAKQEAMEAAERAENERIERYAQEKRDQEERQQRQKEEAEQEKTRVLKAMIGQMEEKSKAAEELEQLRNDLHLEELEMQNRRREEALERKRREEKEDMKKAFEHQMQMKAEKAAALRDEEEQIREQLLKKFAEDDRIEHMNEQKRRMKIQEHKREAQRLIDLKREQYEKSRQAELEAEGKLRAEEEQRLLIVEEERRRLLKEHAADLVGFLPKATLEHHSDLALIQT